MTQTASLSERDIAQKMRILLVSARYFPFMGGTETHVYEVSRRLAIMGNQITILTADPTGVLPAHEDKDGVHIIRVQAYPAKRDYYFAPRIYPIITRGGWDLIHCQGYHTLVAPLAMLAAWRARIPYLVTFHSGGHSSRLRNAARGLQWLLLYPLLVHAAKLIGVSDFEADFFAKQLGIDRTQFVVVPNGSHLPKPDGASGSTDYLRSTSPLIISVGRLEFYKRHQDVIRAFPKVLEQVPQARLRILGTGPYEENLTRLVHRLRLSEKVEIGAIPPSDRQGMSTLLSSASLVMLLSEYEAHPVAVMEALSLHRPVLVSDTSGLRELARRGLVRSIPLNSSSEEIATAVVQSLRDPLIAPVADLPTWDQCASSLLSLYQSCKVSAIKPSSGLTAQRRPDLPTQHSELISRAEGHSNRTEAS